MGRLFFTKMRGLGNDFIVLDWLNRQPSLYLPALARRLCHRHFGIGADGLLVLVPCTAGFRLRIFNPDGSEAETCGNALRCAARYLWEQGYTKKREFSIITPSGARLVHLHIAKNRVKHITVDMGRPRFAPAEIPVKLPGDAVIACPLNLDDGVTVKITCVNLGNPHCVLFTEGKPRVMGPKIERLPLFPQRTNVEFVKVINTAEIRVAVWERGVGETLACGSGACAAAIAAHLNGYTGRKVKVHLASGRLSIHWHPAGQVYMTGPATTVFTGTVPC